MQARKSILESPQKHEDQDQSHVHRRHNGDIHDCGASDVGGGGDDGGVGGGGTTKSWRVASVEVDDSNEIIDQSGHESSQDVADAHAVQQIAQPSTPASWSH